jgi:hypothetical protein
MCGLMVECLPAMHKALGLILSTRGKKERTKKVVIFIFNIMQWRVLIPERQNKWDDLCKVLSLTVWRKFPGFCAERGISEEEVQAESSGLLELK